MWVKHVWDATHIMYKAALKDWFKGTGGISGASAMFEGWDDKKMSRHNIDPDTYDHTDISNIPSLLYFFLPDFYLEKE